MFKSFRNIGFKSEPFDGMNNYVVYLYKLIDSEFSTNVTVIAGSKCAIIKALMMEYHKRNLPVGKNVALFLLSDSTMIGEFYIDHMNRCRDDLFASPEDKDTYSK